MGLVCCVLLCLLFPQVVNDDGPPSSKSPYVLPFVELLKARGHLVSVVLPQTHISWIGKAHFPDIAVKATAYHPGAYTQDREHDRTTVEPKSDQSSWTVLTTTPAACVQIGLFHLFRDQPPIDLVVSGPNFGRNTTSLFTLSSGTVGAALEAATCGKRAIATSFASSPDSKDAAIITAGLHRCVALIEYLQENWVIGVDLYCINIPLMQNVGSQRIFYTDVLQASWTRCLYREIYPSESGRPQHELPDSSSSSENTCSRLFAWKSEFKDVYESAEHAAPTTDGSVVREGHTR